jgi:hypothetical protein
VEHSLTVLQNSVKPKYVCLAAKYLCKSFFSSGFGKGFKVFPRELCCCTGGLEVFLLVLLMLTGRGFVCIYEGFTCSTRRLYLFTGPKKTRPYYVFFIDTTFKVDTYLYNKYNDRYHFQANINFKVSFDSQLNYVLHRDKARQQP